MTTTLKTKTTRTARKLNCIEKSDNQGVKEETFIQTGRRGRDRQPGQKGLAARQGGWRTKQGDWLRNTACQAAASRPCGHTFMHRLIGRNGRGVKQTTQPRTPEWGNKASKLWLKTPVGVEAAAGETPSLTGEWVGETHRGLEREQAHPPTRKSAPEGPSLIVGSRGSDWNPAESGASSSAPSQPLTHVQHHSAATSVTPPWWTPKAPPLCVTGTPRQKKMTQMKEQIKAPEIIQLSSEETANLSDAQFKTLVIRKLTELVEFGHKLDEKKWRLC